MTKKQLLDLIWEKIASDKEQALKDWDKYALLGDYLDARKFKGAYEALNKIRDFVLDLYKNPDTYR